MTIEVLFIQGASTGAHAADQCLVDALERALGKSFRVRFPRLPDEQDPDTATWKGAVGAALDQSRTSVLVAHSAGAAIVADMLARRHEGDGGAVACLRGVVLLAPPFVGEGGWALPGFQLDPSTASPCSAVPALHLFFGSADQTVPPEHAALYARTFPHATIHHLAGGDHQFGGFMMRVAKTVRTLACA